jgi:hypothetical protein
VTITFQSAKQACFGATCAIIQQVEGDGSGRRVEVDEEDEDESSVGLAIEAL